MPFIDVIDYEKSEGELREIYDDLIQTRGKLAEVHKIQSLNPKSIVAHMDLYLVLMFGKSPLKRYQREMIAVVVSKANNCDYCQVHHAEALEFYWKDKDKVERFCTDYRSVDLSESDLELCHFAWNTTLKAREDGKQIEKLKSLSFTDRHILDATLIISYFNFVNRIVLSLGVSLEENAGGYKYD